MKENDEFVTDGNESSKMTMDYFKRLYTATGDVTSLQTSFIFPTLSEASIREIEDVFTDIEIKDADMQFSVWGLLKPLAQMV